MALQADSDETFASEYDAESYVNKPREDAINTEIVLISGKLQDLNAKNMACGNTLTPKIQQLKKQLDVLRRQLAYDPEIEAWLKQNFPVCG